jgi:hypothetical protein
MILCLQLTPRTRRAKTRVQQLRGQHPGWDGTTWRVLVSRDTVAFSDKPGPWFFVRPDAGHPDERAERWVNGTADENFDVKHRSSVT